MMRQHSGPEDLPASVEAILSQIHDAFVELEVWRQHARSSEERAALHRLTTLLVRASQDIRRMVVPVADPAQEILPLGEGQGS